MDASKVKINVPMMEVANGITMEVEIAGYKGWLVRLDIALLLIRLACFIAGFGYSEKETA